MSDYSRSMRVPLGKLLGKTTLGQEPSWKKWKRWFLVGWCAIFCASGLWAVGDSARTLIKHDWFSPLQKPIVILQTWSRVIHNRQRADTTRNYALFRFKDSATEADPYVISHFVDEQPSWLFASGSLSSAETQFKSLRVYVPCRLHPGFSIALTVTFSCALSGVMAISMRHFLRYKLQ